MTALSRRPTEKQPCAPTGTKQLALIPEPCACACQNESELLMSLPVCPQEVAPRSQPGEEGLRREAVQGGA